MDLSITGRLAKQAKGGQLVWASGEWGPVLWPSVFTWTTERCCLCLSTLPITGTDLGGLGERSEVFSSHPLLTSSPRACVKPVFFLLRKKRPDQTIQGNELEFRVDLRRQIASKDLLLSTGAS